MEKEFVIFPGADLDYDSWDLARGSSLSEESLGKDFAKTIKNSLSFGSMICVSTRDKIKFFTLSDGRLKSKTFSSGDQAGVREVISKIHQSEKLRVFV